MDHINFTIPNGQAAAPPRNTTSEFYFSLSDGRIIHAKFTKLHTLEIAQRLNDSIPTNRNNAPSLIQQQQSVEYYDQHTSEFYLPEDIYIYHVIFAELHSPEIVQRLNNNTDSSHIPDYQRPHHCSVQSLIEQQIRQSVDYQQQNGVQQPSFDMYSDNNNNVYNASM